MNELKLLLRKSTDPSDVLYGLLPLEYSYDSSLDTSNLDSLFNHSDQPPESLSSNYLHELVGTDTKSDYVIFSDYHSSEFEISEVIFGFDNINWMDDSHEIFPLKWVKGDLRGLEGEDFNNSINNYSDPYIKCRYIDKFTIVERHNPLIPNEWGDIVELGIQYHVGNSTQYITTSIQVVEGEVFTKYLSGFTGVNIIEPIQWKETSASTDIYDLHYNSDSSQVADDNNHILFSYFGKSDVNILFELVISDKNIFIYPMSNVITNYKVIYCKVYKPINWESENE